MRHWTLWGCLLLLTMAATAWGQDPGNPDTLFVGSVSTNAGQKAVISVNFYNDETLAALTIPLHWDSPAITLDSVSFAGSRVSYINSQQDTIYDSIQGVVFGVIVFAEHNIPAGTGLAGKLYFNIPAGTPDQFVHIDSTTIDPANLLFTRPDASSFTPIMKPGKITIGNPILPGHIVLNPTTMTFQGIYGYTGQVSNNLSIGDGYGVGYKWTATWKSTWLSTAPSSGTAPSVTAVRAVISGLPIGTYYDTIVVASATVDNSPQNLPVVLNVTAPAPVISLSPLSFAVSAIQNGSNPADRVLYITDTVSGSQLNWTASHNSTWLSLAPTSGTSPDSVVLSFNVSGLGYGTYYDTVVVSDPHATNTPQRVPVTFQVVSSLPILAYNPSLLYVLATKGQDAAEQVVHIYNSGQGTLTYSASESSSRITGLLPASGSAPTDMTVSFKTYPLSEGEYYDTITVTSPEALNSPQYLPVHIHVTTTPARLAVTPGTVSYSYYECWQGPDSSSTTRYLHIQNTGGDSLHWKLTHNHDWLVISSDSGIADAVVALSLNAAGLAVGTYTDTITVTSFDALNGSRQIPVTLSIIAGSLTPRIVVDTTPTDLFVQERFGPDVVIGVSNVITNANPGCMDYHILSNVPWLDFNDSIGQAPKRVTAKVVVGNYTYGIYPDSFYFASNSASNSPIKVRLRLLVWKYHGDNNWDDHIDVADIVYLINYIFISGPMPKPEILVSDCNCDGLINVADAVFLLNYVFKRGNAPCGNP